MTVSHLRFGPQPINSTYLVNDADFVACHHFDLLNRVDVLDLAKDGATFLLNSTYGPDKIWDQLPGDVRRQLQDKHINFWVIDGDRIYVGIASGQEGLDLGHHVVVAGIVLHGRRGPLPVHRHPADAAPGRHRPQRRRHVVDQGRPDGHGRLGDRLLGGVDRHADVGAQRLDDRHDPTELLVGRHLGGLRTGGLAAHVDDVGALRDQLQAPGHGPVRVQPATPVRERVRRHVEDPHDQGPVRSGGVRGRGVGHRPQRKPGRRRPRPGS